MAKLKVMSIDEIAKKAAPQVIEIPGWNDDFIAVRVKRPSMLGMANRGLIPNSLLVAAQKVFTQTVDGDISLQDISNVMETVVKAALVEPTYEEFQEAGLEFTDDQVVAIFSYTQEGLKGLESFRTDKAGSEDSDDGKAL